MESCNFRNKNIFIIGLGHLLYKCMGGWRVTGSFPDARKYVIIVAHHTSNWDFLVGLGCMWLTGLCCRFLAKDSLFVGPLGWFLRKIGGVPVARNTENYQVERIVSRIKKSVFYILCVTPEGTRAKVSRWKTGFYHIALQADIPILPIALDYKNKEMVIGELFFPVGDMEKDMRQLHLFFLPYSPKYPENACQGPFKEREHGS